MVTPSPAPRADSDGPSAAGLALSRRVATGEPGAAEELVRTHLDDLYEFVHWRVGGDRGRAEDVVQDTFLIALERAQDFDGRASLHTWLCGIAKNRIREDRRRRRPVPIEDVLADADTDIDAILAEVEREDLPGWVVERRETRELVGATLSSLPADYKRALIDKYVEGLSVGQMAARLGRGEKATESLLTRSRRAFARVFELLARRRGELG